MATTLLIAIFVIGYCAITLEHTLKVNKAAPALLTGIACWVVYILSNGSGHHVLHELEAHMGELSGILFFLLGAMVIVELIDAHDGFDIITSRIKLQGKVRLMWLICLVTFFLSAILDNLTTTIVMISVLRKLIPLKSERLFFVGLTVIAANAGGAWSPMGDVTTTMLWIGGQITVLPIIKGLFLPSLACVVVPLAIISFQMRGVVEPVAQREVRVAPSSALERRTVFGLGIGVLFMVPAFKTLTGLPPFMGMLFGLGLMWVLTELIHGDKNEAEKGVLSVNHAIRKIDTPSILFFLGILLAISALESTGLLSQVAKWLEHAVGNIVLLGLTIGLLSAIIDNVPLVAAAQGMYTLNHFPIDSFFWQFLAYCAGTGGSALIVGSAAGVAAMGLEQVNFFWYFKKMSFLAVAGYLAGAGVYLLQRMM